MNGSRNPYQKSGGISTRAICALALCFLLPPVGLLYMWRQGIFVMRGRIIITCAACLEMMLLLSWGLFGLFKWDDMPPAVYPVPGAAAAVTAHPDDETINALSNIDEIIAMGMAQRDPGETISPDATPMLTQDEMLAQQQEVLNTVVYSVYRGAKYYHVSTVCGNQSNGRALTIAEALAEQMGACPNCDPPTP